MIDDAKYNELYWHCRRGMWELDLYLIPFMRAEYRTLDPAIQANFELMLTMPDVELHAALNGHTAPANPQLTTVINLVRSHAKTSDKSSVF